MDELTKQWIMVGASIGVDSNEKVKLLLALLVEKGIITDEEVAKLERTAAGNGLETDVVKYFSDQVR